MLLRCDSEFLNSLNYSHYEGLTPFVLREYPTQFRAGVLTAKRSLSGWVRRLQTSSRGKAMPPGHLSTESRKANAYSGGQVEDPRAIIRHHADPARNDSTILTRYPCAPGGESSRRRHITWRRDPKPIQGVALLRKRAPVE